MSRHGGAGQDAIFAALRRGIKFKRGPAGLDEQRKPTEVPFHSHASLSPSAEVITSASSTQELNALRNRRKIRVVGDAPPIIPDMGSLSTAGVPAVLLANMADLGWNSLTDTQMQSIPTLLGERDVLSIAPTGSGKTGAFVVPMITRLLQTLGEGEFAATLPKGTLGIHFDNKWPVVNEVETGQLAAKLAPRVKPGCRLVSINGRHVDGLPFTEAVPLIQQRPVRLVWREADAPPIQSVGVRGVILAPTRELAAQISRETKRLAANTGLVVTLLEDHDDATFDTSDILVSTPLRLAALIRSSKRRLDAVKVLVVRTTSFSLAGPTACVCARAEMMKYQPLS
jgi:hypothetical protein